MSRVGPSQRFVGLFMPKLVGLGKAQYVWAELKQRFADYFGRQDLQTRPDPRVADYAGPMVVDYAGPKGCGICWA